MGATVFNRARAWSKKLSNGKVVYLWEENTHCIKDGPREASWCAMKFGDQAAIIRRIYKMAQSIPGGTLKVKHRSVATFVESMLEVLANPAQLKIDSVRLENGTGFYASVHDDNRHQAIEKMISISRPDIAKKFEHPDQGGGEKFVTLDLENDLDVIVTLLNNFPHKEDKWSSARGIPVWKIFRSSIDYGYERQLPSEEVIQFQKPQKKPLVSLYKTAVNVQYPGAREPEYVVVLTLDGKQVYVGRNDYQLEGKLIQIAADSHVNNGVYCIKELMSGLQSAETSSQGLSDLSSFIFQTTSESKWYRPIFDRFAALVDHAGEVSFSVSHAKLVALSDIDSDLCREVISGRDEATALDVSFAVDEPQVSLFG